MKLVNVVESSGPSGKGVVKSVVGLSHLSSFWVLKDEAPIQAHLSDGMSMDLEWYLEWCLV